jgi:hypothetical protein
MSIKISIKKKFLENFQKGIIQGRRLLQTANHRWADRLLTDLYFEIEKTEWLDLQKKHQLVMIISNSWWMYINSLIKRSNGEVDVDIIRYIDAYKRFFSFLAKLDNFYLFNNFATNLLKTFIEMEDLSQSGITKFINSYCVKVIERGEQLKLVELQMLLMYLRKSVVPQEYFHFSMEILGKILFKLDPSKRALFLYIILENININYQLTPDSDDFVKDMVKILSHRIPGYLKNEFSNLNKIIINEKTHSQVIEELEELISYLNYIGEFSWIIIIVKNMFSKIRKYQSYGDAVTYIRKYIDFSINRNKFEIAFEIYDFLEDLFLYQTDLGYDNILIELWVEACKKFVDMKEKKFLLQSLEKLDTHLKAPQTSPQIFHYFYTCNFLWQFKSLFFSLDQKDFWRMIFYRAVYEEQDFILATKILSFLDKNIAPMISNPKALYQETKGLEREIYSFESPRLNAEILDKEFVIEQMIFRINSKGLISYRMISNEGQIIEGRIKDEYWNDMQIIDLYSDIFSDKEKREYEFSLTDFGKILYLFLPYTIRTILKKFEIKSLELIPEIYFILDQMTIPFELVYDTNFFLLKYSIGYIIGEPPLGGISFGKLEDSSQEDDEKKKYNVIIIDCMNSKGPLRWNEKKKGKELIFPFTAGKSELEFITDFFANQNQVNSINILSETKSTRENILESISQEIYQIIHIVGNIFYSKWNPSNSFLLTNSNEIVRISDINDAIKLNPHNIKPLIFVNSQLFDVIGGKLKNVVRIFGDIAEQFDYEEITGIVSHNYPIFDEETQEFTKNFYNHIFMNYGQGISLLKARQICMANKMAELAQKKALELTAEDGTITIDLESSLAISSYSLYGKPWKKV